MTPRSCTSCGSQVPDSYTRLFYPRSPASATNLVEPVASGDQLTARLGTLADVFDLFMRGPDEEKSKTLTSFREELMRRLTDDGARERARDAVGRLLDVNEIRNGRLHTDTTTWAACLGRLGITPSDLPDQQWELFERQPSKPCTRLSRCCISIFRSSLSKVLCVPRSPTLDAERPRPARAPWRWSLVRGQ